MAFRLKALLQRSVCYAALAAAVLGGPSSARAAQPTGIGALGEDLPHSRALRVLRQMQRDSVGVNSRHYEAAQRCDRAAMEAYRRQLEELAAQARNVIRNSGLLNDTSSNAITADEIAANIEMRAREAAARQPQNCGDPEAQGVGSTGSQTGTQSQAQRLSRLEAEARLARVLHIKAVARCDAEEMARRQAELDNLAREARQLAEAAREAGADPAAAEEAARRIAKIADEQRAMKPENCEEQPKQQPSGTGETGANTTGSTPRQGAMSTPPSPSAEEKVAQEQRELVRQQELIAEAEGEIELIRRLLRQGRCIEALELANQLEEWIDFISNPPPPTPGGFGVPPPKIPPDVIREWRRQINEAFKECAEPGSTQTAPPAEQPPSPGTAPPPLDGHEPFLEEIGEDTGAAGTAPPAKPSAEPPRTAPPPPRRKPEEVHVPPKPTQEGQPRTMQLPKVLNPFNLLGAAAEEPPSDRAADQPIVDGLNIFGGGDRQQPSTEDRRRVESRKGHSLQFDDSSKCTELNHDKGRKVVLDDDGMEVADERVGDPGRAPKSAGGERGADCPR